MELRALGVFAIYATVGFGIRTWVHIRRTGDSGFRGQSGRPGSSEWWAGILFAAVLVTAVAGPVAGLAGFPAVGLLDHDRVHALGNALAVAGIAATFVTQLAMGESWRVGVEETEHTNLVTDGPFALVRNWPTPRMWGDSCQASACSSRHQANRRRDHFEVLADRA